MVGLYVDDLMYTGNHWSLIEAFNGSIKLEFEMSELGMKYFLGVEVRQGPYGIHLSRQKYGKDVREKFKMSGNSVKNPIVPGT